MTGRRPAVIVDMDGTLVDVTTALPHLVDDKGRKSFDRFHEASRTCPPNAQAIAFCVRHWAAGHVVCVVTARKYQWQELSEAWLGEHLPVPYVGPFMRGDLDNRADVDVKRDIHRILTRDHEFEIVGAIDDNPPIIELWQGLGIPTEVVPREWDQ
ncbi:DNA binding protein [Gordonia phage EdmundFerry]|nr:DNA binding protein [Gordonia phage EdmundFerry]